MKAISNATPPGHDVLHRQREHMRLELQGVKLNKAQRDFWRVALRSEILSRYGIDTARGFRLEELGKAIADRSVA